MAQEVTRLVIDQNTLKTTQGEVPVLGDEDVRIQVLYTAISNNDVLLLEGKHRNDYFGTGAVGKVTAKGKKVGQCNVGDIVGVYHDNNNVGEFQTGFSTFVQVNQHQILYIPTTIESEQAANLIGTGVIAFNVVSKLEPNTTLAVVGTGSLAYLITQFAKKLSDIKVTIFGYEGGEELAKEWGAQSFVALSADSLQKNTEKYQFVVVTDIVKEADAHNLLNLSWRNSKTYFTVDMGFNPNVAVLDLICSQKSFVGVKRGDFSQSVKALKAAAYHGVRGKVEVFESGNYVAAFEKAKNSGASTIVLKY